MIAPVLQKLDKCLFEEMFFGSVAQVRLFETTDSGRLQDLAPRHRVVDEQHYSEEVEEVREVLWRLFCDVSNGRRRGIVVIVVVVAGVVDVVPQRLAFEAAQLRAEKDGRNVADRNFHFEFEVCKVRDDDDGEGGEDVHVFVSSFEV